MKKYRLYTSNSFLLSLLCLIFTTTQSMAEGKDSHIPPSDFSGYLSRFQVFIRDYSEYHPNIVEIKNLDDTDSIYWVLLQKKELNILMGEPDISTEIYSIILNLWFLKEYEFLENLWWKSENSELRMFIMSLFLCQKGDFSVKNRVASFHVPHFALYSKRFSSEEAELRYGEWLLLEKNIIELRKKLTPLLYQLK